MAKRDYYEILGVDRGADQDTIKKTFRKLAVKYHPDKHKGDKAAEAKFKEINEAYEVLKDEKKRQAYDQMGHQAFEGGSGSGAHGFDFNFGGGAGGFSDIFDEMFGQFTGRGGGRARSAAQRGSDLEYNAQITLEEAYAGTEKTISLSANAQCSKCKGSGAESGTNLKTCETCHGAGKVRMQQGFFSIERGCPKCHGAGQVIEKPCSSCAGMGRKVERKAIKVSIPAGIEDGTRIRLAGKGEGGVRGGPAGDLYVFVSIKPHKVYQRSNADLHMQVPVSLATAALGGKVTVSTIDGKKASVTVPEGTQAGHQLRLKGKGMSILRRATVGDLYLHFMVQTPVNLSKQQKDLLKEFDKLATAKNIPHEGGFFSQFKKFFHCIVGILGGLFNSLFGFLTY